MTTDYDKVKSYMFIKTGFLLSLTPSKQKFTVYLDITIVSFGTHVYKLEF